MSGSSKIFGKDWARSLQAAVLYAWQKFDELEDIAACPGYQKLSRFQGQMLKIDYLVKMALESGKAD